MKDNFVFVLIHAFSAAICFIVAAGLLSLKSLRSGSNRKYRHACYYLAAASAIVGIGSLSTIITGESGLAQLGLLAFPVIFIASTQSLLFTFLLVLLFREQYVTRRHVLVHASPSIVLTVLYLAALCWCDNPTVFTFRQWADNLGNPVLLIRTLYALVYIVQLALYPRLFFRQRTLYGESLGQLDSLGREPERLELHWVTHVFLYALTIGLCALSLCFILSPLYEMILTGIFAAFYLLSGYYYVNYHFTYDIMRKELFKANAPLTETPQQPKPEKAETPGLGTLVDELAKTKVQEMNQKLFAKAEQLMNDKQLFLEPTFNRKELVSALYTNEHYLTRTLKQHAYKSIQDYITRYRYDYAHTLLQNPYNKDSIEQVAINSGFPSVRSFNRNFKMLNKDGFTPSEFRKLYQ